VCFASGAGTTTKPPLELIPVQRPFQIVEIDMNLPMNLPKNKDGNKHVLVLQDILTKWPMVYPMPDQKIARIVKILIEEFFRCLECQRHCCLTEEQTYCHF